MTFDIETEVDAIINGFTHANVTGVSGKPVRKYLSDKDLHSISDRQTNGLIRFTQETLINHTRDTANSMTEEYLFFGHTILDVSINEMQFLSELNRLFNVNNQSISRTSEYFFTWEFDGLIGTGMTDFALRLEIKKQFVDDDL